MRRFGFFLLNCLIVLSLNNLSLSSQTENNDLEKDPYWKLIEASFTACGQGNFAQAEAELSKAIRMKLDHPITIYLLNNLGGYQQILGKYDQAILSYSAALTKDPDEQTIRFNRARLYAQMKRYKSALTDYALLLGLNPKNELFRYHRAMIYLLTEDYDLAELDLSEILKLSPESLKARIGYALLETMRASYDKAEMIYEHLLGKLPNSAEVYEGRARMYLARKMLGFAVRDMEQAFKLAKDSTSPSLYRLKAEIEQALGNKEEAKKSLSQANKLELRFDPLKSKMEQ